ncbi:MAG: Rpn family recombination-promoting nuclease/putative transposase [Spirochaetaceae bacterium]|jgi:predicted transposase/invertase (TIGR01784 family)|nr:Rpn family recombination-promoting nuclease/putative transposase [Spirochaetaceae bacterium]
MTIMLPKVDFAFKLLFGDQRSKNILTDFLKAVLPDLAQEEFEEVSIVDPHLKREFSGDKLEILDVKVRTASGKSIDIEIQISDMPEMRSRISYYLSNMITEQIGTGGHYSELKQAISIVITDYDFIPETRRCHTVFRMLEKDEYFPFNELMEINVLNLERLPADEDSKLMDWLRFLKAEQEEEFKMLAEKNPVINEAYCKLQAMSEDEANRMIYEARLKAQRDDYSRMQGARREGREDIILQMAEHGMTAKDIAAITRLSEQEIGAVLKGAGHGQGIRCPHKE